jgi:hypothetical protein
MKKIRIIQAAIAIAFVTLVASCGSSREYSYYPPRPSASFSLILNSGPGIYATRYPDGRYYYRNPQGYIYWRGYDNRYYLDRSYLGRVPYSKREYYDWNRYYNSRGKRYRY